VFALHGPCVQVPALPSNNIRVRATRATSVYPLAVSSTIDILNVQTTLVFRHGPTTLRHVPPGREEFLRRVPQVVLRCHSVLHQYLVQRNQDCPTHSLSLSDISDIWINLGPLPWTSSSRVALERLCLPRMAINYSGVLSLSWGFPSRRLSPGTELRP
jgi:hypothetical protein